MKPDKQQMTFGILLPVILILIGPLGIFTSPASAPQQAFGWSGRFNVTQPASPSRQPDPAARLRLAKEYGKLPLSFEANQGLSDPTVKFLSRGSGYSLFLTSNEAVLVLRQGKSENHQVTKTRRGATERGVDLSRAVQASPFFISSRSLVPEGRHADESAVGALEAVLASAGLALPLHEDIELPAPSVLRMKLVGANPAARVTGLDELPGKSNYFVGNDPKKWQTNIPNYAQVKYQDIYPGVDLVYYGNQRELEYDWVVEPGADPKAIRFAVAPVSSPATAGQRPALQIAPNGDLVIPLDGPEGREVRFQKPVVYQSVSNLESRTPSPEKHFVDGRYVLQGKREVSFRIASYDASKALVIDPALSYSTYLGGTQVDFAFRIAVDSSGSAYVTGVTNSTNFPTTAGAYKTGLAPGTGMCSSSFGSLVRTMVFTCPDAFVTKLNPAGSAKLYSTYLGGSSGDAGVGIAVDGSGDAYVTGFTSSSDFPTTPGAYKTTRPGRGDAFVTKLDPTGSSLVYSTYLGGSQDDIGLGVAVDGSGNAFVTGGTSSIDFPTSSGAFQASNGGPATCATGFLDHGRGTLCFDAFVTKLDSAGANLVYSTYLGGNADDAGTAIALDSSGNAYVTGVTSSTNFPTRPNPGAIQPTNGGGTCKANSQTFACPDAFVTKLNTAGSALLYSTYLGGSDVDAGFDIAVDSSGSAYVTGGTNSAKFPVTSGAFQTTSGASVCGTTLHPFPCPHAFVTKLNSAGTSLAYSTFLAGSNADLGLGVTVDNSGDAFVVGGTNSPDFNTVNPVQAPFGGGSCNTKTLVVTCPNAFVTELNPAGSAELFSTFLGGAGGDIGFGIALDSAQTSMYVTGATRSADFPTANALQAALGGLADAFVAKISPSPAGPSVTVSPTSLSFGSQLVTTTSAPQTVTLTNSGSLSLFIYKITFAGADSGDFAQTGNCPLGLLRVPLRAGASCALNVTFTPAAAGSRTGTLTITDNVAGSPQTVPLSGTGTDFSIAAASGSSTSATVTAGQTATYKLAFTPAGLSGSLALNCSGAPQGAHCTVSPTSLMLNGSTAATATVMVTTTARSMVVTRPQLRPPAAGKTRRPLPWFWLMALGLLASLVAARRRRVRLGVLALGVSLLFVVFWAACGGGGGVMGGGGGGTPAGTYTLTVSGTFTSGSTTLKHDASLTLKVN